MNYGELCKESLRRFSSSPSMETATSLFAKPKLSQIMHSGCWEAFLKFTQEVTDLLLLGGLPSLHVNRSLVIKKTIKLTHNKLTKNSINFFINL